MAYRFAWIALALVAALASSGCSRFRVYNRYDSATPGRALEVPPDLSTPSTLGALTIPAGGNGARGTGDPGLPGLPAAALVTEVTIADDPASGFRRVGLALERSGVATIVKRDEASATFDVRIGYTVVEEKPGFFRRMFSRGGGKSVSVDRVVRLVPASGGSKVQVEDGKGTPVDDDAAHRLLGALKERLG